MHEPVKQRLEEYLDGGEVPEIEEHLRNCQPCREEVEAMRAQSLLFRALRPPRSVEPEPAFYTRLIHRIETQSVPSVWSLFGESLFAKRLVYASAMLVFLLGTAFISSTSSDDGLPAGTPEVILAGHAAPEPVSMEDQQRDREVILANLASWGDSDQDYQ